MAISRSQQSLQFKGAEYISVNSNEVMTNIPVTFTKKQVLTQPLILCAVGFGSGLLPFAPGTWGSLLALFIYLGLNQLPFYGYLICLVLAFIFGIFCCGIAAKAVGLDDHPSIVWDEFVGYWITMLLAPSGWWWMIVGFVLFRIIDIYKPFPIAILERRFHSGFGIMLDDAVAGVYAWGLLHIIVWIVETVSL